MRKITDEELDKLKITKSMILSKVGSYHGIRWEGEDKEDIELSSHQYGIILPRMKQKQDEYWAKKRKKGDKEETKVS